MPIVDRYILRQIFTATFFVTVILLVLIFLTQSLRFLDLVIKAGASAWAIWVQTFLVMPGFFEVILPISVVASVLFVYNRATIDNELIALRALGFSPLRLGRPAILLSTFLGCLLFIIMGWVAPASRAEALQLRQDITQKVTSLIFQEGIFNNTGAGLMVYIRDRDNAGTMRGLIIHDSRAVDKPATTIIASKGILVSTDKGQQVVVYKGSRQELDVKTGALRRLDFDTYTVDLPTTEKDASVRFNEPDERTLSALLKPLSKEEKAQPNLKRQMRTEIQKRFLSPLLVPSFCLVGMSFLLLGGYDRRGQSLRILAAVAAIMVLQILYLSSYHLAKQSSLGFPFMIITTVGPMVISYLLLRRGPLSFVPVRRL